MTFAAQLKEARLAAGLTQAEAAKLLGVTAQAVYFWEAGKRIPPTGPSLTQENILTAINGKPR